MRSLKQLVRESEVRVYAVGIDGQGGRTWSSNRGGGGRIPLPVPFPVPGRRPPQWPGYPPTQPGGSGGGTWSRDDRVNVSALRELTDDIGGRTEVVRSAQDLDPATANIVDELSQQYYLGYPSPGFRAGRWHTIRVEVRDPSLKVRARRGYVATP